MPTSVFASPTLISFSLSLLDLLLRFSFFSKKMFKLLDCSVALFFEDLRSYERSLHSIKKNPYNHFCFENLSKTDVIARRATSFREENVTPRTTTN